MTTKQQRRAAYAAGWRASERASSPQASLDRSEARWCAKHPDPDSMFSAGWLDVATGAAKWSTLRREHPADFDQQEAQTMATREPRRTEYRVDWHREPTPDGTPKWWAGMHGVRVAEAAMTGRHGVDDYPWDWWLTDTGNGLRQAGARTSGVTDSLRSVKEYVDAALRPRQNLAVDSYASVVVSSAAQAAPAATSTTEGAPTMDATTSSTPVEATTAGDKTKQCRTCGGHYLADTTNGQKASSYPDGLWPECKVCANAYQAVWRLTKAAKLVENLTVEQKALRADQLAAAQALWNERKALGVGRLPVKVKAEKPAKAPKAAKVDAPAVDGTAAQAAELAELEAALAANGGAGTDAGQAVLAAAADAAAEKRRAADRDRKARARAAAKAAKADAAA